MLNDEQAKELLDHAKMVEGTDMEGVAARRVDTVLKCEGRSLSDYPEGWHDLAVKVAVDVARIYTVQLRDETRTLRLERYQYLNEVRVLNRTVQRYARRAKRLRRLLDFARDWFAPRRSVPELRRDPATHVSRIVNRWKDMSEAFKRQEGGTDGTAGGDDNTERDDQRATAQVG